MERCSLLVSLYPNLTPTFGSLDKCVESLERDEINQYIGDITKILLRNIEKGKQFPYISPKMIMFDRVNNKFQLYIDVSMPYEKAKMPEFNYPPASQFLNGVVGLNIYMVGLLAVYMESKGKFPSVSGNISDDYYALLKNNCNVKASGFRCSLTSLNKDIFLERFELYSFIEACTAILLTKKKNDLIYNYSANEIANHIYIRGIKVPSKLKLCFFDFCDSNNCSFSKFLYKKGGIGQILFCSKPRKYNPKISDSLSWIPYYLIKKPLKESDKMINDRYYPLEIENNIKLLKKKIPNAIFCFDYKNVSPKNSYDYGKYRLFIPYQKGICLYDFICKAMPTNSKGNDGYPPIPEDFARDIFLDIAKAVNAIHNEGIIFRDLNPRNIIVHFENGAIRAKLIDFGVAKSEGEAETNVGVVYFKAPEMQEESYSLQVDVYSYGILLYYSLTGIFIHKDKYDMEFSTKHGISMYAIDLIEKCVQNNPLQRIRSFAEIINHPFFLRKNYNSNSNVFNDIVFISGNQKKISSSITINQTLSKYNIL